MMIRHKQIPSAVDYRRRETFCFEPHLWQQSFNRLELLVRFHMQTGHSYPWGVVKLKWDKDQLSKGVLSLSHLECIMPDGLAVVVHEPERKLRLDLNTAAFDVGKGEFPVFLTAPPFPGQRAPYLTSRSKQILHPGKKERNLPCF